MLQLLVTPALPEIQTELGTSTTAVAWLITVFVLVASVVTPILGRLSDIFGKDRVLLLVLACVAIGCLVAALSHSLPMLIVGRALQGVGGGAVAVIGFAIVRDEFPPARIATGMGILSAAWGAGGGVGIVLSGVVVDNLSYQWLFWLGFAVFLVATVASYFFVPESPVKTPAAIDWLGAALLALGLGAVLLGVSEGTSWGWSSGAVVGLIGGGTAMLAAWVRWEWDAAEPLVDIRLLASRGVWTVNAASGLIGFGMYVLLILLPKFVQTPPAAGYGFGATVTEAGLFLLPWTLALALAAPVAGLLANRVGSRSLLLTGVVCAAGAFTFFALAHNHRWQIMLATSVIGIGIGCTHSSLQNLIAQAVPQTQIGEALGTVSITRTVGASLGTQFGAVVVSAALVAGTSIPSERGYVIAFLVASLAFVLAFAAGVLVPTRRSLKAGRRAVGESLA